MNCFQAQLSFSILRHEPVQVLPPSFKEFRQLQCMSYAMIILTNPCCHMLYTKRMEMDHPAANGFVILSARTVRGRKYPRQGRLLRE